MADRTVHARYPGMEIVRYERAGKWYLEPTDPSLKRQQVSMRVAVRSAVWGLTTGGEVFFGRPGGAAFDRKVREHAAAEGVVELGPVGSERAREILARRDSLASRPGSGGTL